MDEGPKNISATTMGIFGDRPNAVHLMIIGAQQYLLFMSSFPFLGKYCFVRRLTTRGLDRPLGLV